LGHLAVAVNEPGRISVARDWSGRVEYILKVECDHPDRQIAVLVPELVVKHWWQTPLHNQRAQLLKLLLLVSGNPRVMVINIPWYL
jgi:hypothetical protein